MRLSACITLCFFKYTLLSDLRDDYCYNNITCEYESELPFRRFREWLHKIH